MTCCGMSYRTIASTNTPSVKAELEEENLLLRLVRSIEGKPVSGVISLDPVLDLHNLWKSRDAHVCLR
jgi:hypothetical protein